MSRPVWEDVTELASGSSITLGGNRVVVGSVRNLKPGKERNVHDLMLTGVMNGSVVVEIRFRNAPDVPRVKLSE